MSAAGLGERVAALRTVLVRQRREPWEWMTGFETRNKYALADERGAELGFAAEQQKGFGGFLVRQLLGHWRRFEIHVFDPSRRLGLRVIHPWRFFFQRLEVQDEAGRRLGAVQQRFAVLGKAFDVEDAGGRAVLRVRSPVWRLWTFAFERQGVEVARVEKRWTGLLAEVFTDRDTFRLTFGPSASATERLLVLAASLFVDLVYFERKAD
ncbi:MAG TPA: phospholipid scramblase-related protein [Anaeromyxobacteraceae bacterium]|nr:phospholipid scramblase-related protein [Anaeromyxobacteraceae bacterium]